MTASNIFSGIPERVQEEVFETLLERATIRIERIVSHGQVSPEGFWYDQRTDEWVIVLEGSARLLFEGDRGSVDLSTGDYLHIPAHKRHRVEWTDPTGNTVWLAVYF